METALKMTRAIIAHARVITYIPDNLKVHGTQFMPKKPLMKNVIVEATQV